MPISRNDPYSVVNTIILETVQNAGRCCSLSELTQRESLWICLGEIIQCKQILLLGLAEMITNGTNVRGQLVDRIIHDKALDSFTSITEQ